MHLGVGMSKGLRTYLAGLAGIALSGCVAVPYPDDFSASACDTATSRKTLRVVNITSETNTDSVEGIVLSPILVPVTAVFSGAYVVANNALHFGEEALRCRPAVAQRD